MSAFYYSFLTMPECSDTLEKWKKFYYDCLSSEDLITSFIAKKKKKRNRHTRCFQKPFGKVIKLKGSAVFEAFYPETLYKCSSLKGARSRYFR